MSWIVSIPLDAYPADALAALSPGGFSLGAARAAMWLSQLAYEEAADKARTVMQRWQIEPLLIFDCPNPDYPLAGSTRGFVARAGDATLVAFGGTDPLVIANWITDFRVVRNAAGVHRGFDAALDIVWPQLAPLLQAQAGRPLLFAGHSLGAALALLCAGRALAEYGLAPAAVYGFGMPRAGDGAFAGRINAGFGQRLYRLAHGRDMVPSLPPAALGFCHAGRYLGCGRQTLFDGSALTAASTLEPGNGSGLVQAAMDSLRGLLRPPAAPAAGDWQAQIALTRLLPAPLADHLPDRYWNALGG